MTLFLTQRASRTLASFTEVFVLLQPSYLKQIYLEFGLDCLVEGLDTGESEAEDEPAILDLWTGEAWNQQF